jgi:glucose-1-phosphate adenylyltransferase
VPLGIGRDCVIRNAILDFNSSVGDGCRLVNAAGVQHADGDSYSIRDGIIVVHKNAVIPPGTVI